MSLLRVIQFFIFTLALYSIQADDSSQDKPKSDTCAATDKGCGDNIKPKINRKRRIIFDADPGLDDAFALIWLLEGFKNDLYSIEALTTTEGNVSPSDAYRNIMHMVNITMPTLIKQTRDIRNKLKSIPIGKMHKKKKDKNGKYTDEDEIFLPLDSFFGTDGFNGISDIFKDFPNIFASQNKIKKWFKDPNHSPYSEDLIIEKLLKYPNEIILCVGPLTNLYPAEMKHPCVLALIRDIYIMGGTFESGNNNIYNEETTSNTKINTNNSHAKIYMGTINDISSSQCHDNNEKHIYNKNINNISYFNGIIGISANSFRKSPLLPPLENIIENGLESLLNEKIKCSKIWWHRVFNIFLSRSQSVCMFIWI
eukprot:514240_1